jgi:glycosyltransferase involved in cell wall biosynthesis
MYMQKNLKRKKILICVPYTYPFYAGGGRNALNFAKQLNEKQINVRLLALNQNLTLTFKSNIASIPVFRIPYFKFNYITKLFSLIFIVPYYFYFVFTNEVVIIYGNNNIIFEFLIFFGWILNKKVIFRSTMYGDDDISSLINRRKFFKHSRKKILEKIDGYFSLSPKFTESYRNIYSNKEIIFESSQGVDIDQFYPASLAKKLLLLKELNLPLNTIIIISVGFLIRRKGFEQIFNVLSNVDLPFLYIIAGDFKLREDHYLSSKNNEMKYLYNKGTKLLGNKVLFTGPKDNINEYMQVSDIFIINSKKEGLPNSLLEAMACGVCPVTSNLPGLKDYILYDKINCLIFNNDNEMADSVKKLITNDIFRNSLGKNASNFIQENCSLSEVTEKFIDKFL